MKILLIDESEAMTALADIAFVMFIKSLQFFAKYPLDKLHLKS